MPLEFNRKPRSLNELKRWKATEFRQFLLYTGILVLKRNVTHDRYINFLTFHVALTILSCSKYFHLIDYASELLKYFVESFKKLYGAQNMSHNVHNLLHLVDDVKNHGPIDQFSAFPFENFLQSVLKLVRKSEKPLQQIVKRYSERSSVNQKIIYAKNYPIFSKKHNNGPLLSRITFVDQYQTASFSGYTLKIESPNNCCYMKNGDIVQIANFGVSKNGYHIVGRKFNNKQDLYKSTFASSELGIFKIGNLGGTELFSLDEVAFKCVNINFDSECIVFPLLHCQ